MILTIYGTRGSLPVCNAASVKYGGNTTCIGVESECLPVNSALCIDGGSGFFPFAYQVSSKSSITLLHTHYHYDHLQGVLIAPPLYRMDVELNIYGPVDNGVGPREAYRMVMSMPLHPIELSKLERALKFNAISKPSQTVLVVHPEHGWHYTDKEECQGEYFVARDGQKIELAKCLIVTMYQTNHPNVTLAYRLEERPTKKVFVFLTDEEVRATVPVSLKEFLDAADLLIQDAQYDEATYNSRAKGFGHGTPQYAVGLAQASKVKRLGLTHYDPRAGDKEVDILLEAAREQAKGAVDVFTCFDYQKIEL